MLDINQLPEGDRLPRVNRDEAIHKAEAKKEADDIFALLKRFSTGDISVPNFVLYYIDGVDDDLQKEVENLFGEYHAVDECLGFYKIDDDARVWRQTHFCDTGVKFGTYFVGEQCDPTQGVAA